MHHESDNRHTDGADRGRDASRLRGAGEVSRLLLDGVVSMILSKDYAAPKQEETAVEYIWERKGCVQQRREPIVRCCDCKHYELQTVSYSDKPLSVCTAEWCEGVEGDNPLVEPDGFCAWGERKADA